MKAWARSVLWLVSLAVATSIRRVPSAPKPRVPVHAGGEESVMAYNPFHFPKPKIDVLALHDQCVETNLRNREIVEGAPLADDEGHSLLVDSGWLTGTLPGLWARPVPTLHPRHETCQSTKAEHRPARMDLGICADCGAALDVD